MRKANLARLLARRPDGIFLSDFEQTARSTSPFVGTSLKAASKI
jgi:hypothetical protein